MLNPTPEEVNVQVELSNVWGPFSGGELLWGLAQPTVDGRKVAVTVGGRDVAIVKLIADVLPS
jgi:hypothetical protein